MRVLLTGASGFVGSRVARILLRDGCDIQAIARPGSNLWRVSDIEHQMQVVRGDLLHIEKLARPIAAFNPDLCIHLGWFAEPGRYLAASENVDLLSGTLNLARTLAATGCSRFVGVGTCFEYDTEQGYLSERTPLAPSFVYSAAKASTYLMLKNLRPGDMQIAWARLFYLYGPFEDERRLVPSVIRSLLRGEPAPCTRGEQVRDFLHVDDVASALWTIAQSSLVDAVNVGSGLPVTVAQLVRTIGDVMGLPDLPKLGALPYPKGDPPFVCADVRLLRGQTTWEPAYTLAEGLRQTAEWWRHQKQLAPGLRGDTLE